MEITHNPDVGTYVRLRHGVVSSSSAHKDAGVVIYWHKVPRLTPNGTVLAKEPLAFELVPGSPPRFDRLVRGLETGGYVAPRAMVSEIAARWEEIIRDHAHGSDQGFQRQRGAD